MKSLTAININILIFKLSILQLDIAPIETNCTDLREPEPPAEKVRERTRISHGDFVNFIRVKPDLALAALEDAGG